MPNAPKTSTKPIRIADEDWQDLGVVAEALGTDRSKLVNAFIRFYLRRPGARMPRRP